MIGGSSISRASDSSFTLADIGTYYVSFQISANEPGQLMLALNGEELDYTVTGRSTGTSQIVGMSIINVTTENSVLSVRNPSGNSTALTITPLAGGSMPVSAHLTVIKLA